MYGTMKGNDGAQEQAAGRGSALPPGLIPLEPARDAADAAGAGQGRAAETAGSGKRYMVLDVGSWAFDRLNRELNELAGQGWKLIAVAGYGQCGVRLWLVK